MRIYSRRTLRDYWTRHADAEDALAGWYKQVERADWGTPADVTALFPTASILPNNRVVFRIRGNSYRLVVEIFYEGRLVFIKFVGTHAEYDRINAEEVEHG